MKLTVELIEDYLDGSLNSGEAAKLKLWLQGHPADEAKVQRQSRLRALLADSAVEPSAAQSRMMWANIKARAQAGTAPAPVLDLSEPWYAFIFKPWGGTLSAGLATAAVLVLAFVWHPWQAQPLVAPAPVAAAKAEFASAPTAGQEAAAANAGAGLAEAAKAERSDAAPRMKKAASRAAEPSFAPSMDDSSASAAPAAAPAPMLAAGGGASGMASANAEADKPTRNAAPTEVERALADSGVDGMIDAYLAAKRQAPARAASLAPRRSSEQRGMTSSLAGLSRDMASEDSVADSKAINAALGGPDNNGFWDWRPAAVAMNRRDWSQVRIELDAARSHAAESVERSFAGSALTLLSAPGAPLAGQTQALPGTGELRVLGAGRWQLISESRLARFSEGVSARLPGFRSEGDSLLLDLTFDRGTFSPGTRFVRVSGDAPAEVLDAQGAAVSADEFSAPTGATYNVSGRQLKLR